MRHIAPTRKPTSEPELRKQLAALKLQQRLAAAEGSTVEIRCDRVVRRDRCGCLLGELVPVPEWPGWPPHAALVWGPSDGQRAVWPKCNIQGPHSHGLEEDLDPEFRPPLRPHVRRSSARPDVGPHDERYGRARWKIGCPCGASYTWKESRLTMAFLEVVERGHHTVDASAI